MIETIVEYVLKYHDPDRTVEGPEKTRRFDTEQRMRIWLEGLDRFAPNAHSVQLLRQTTTIKWETLH